MKRDEVATALDTLKPGECVGIPLHRLTVLFGPVRHDQKAMQRAMAFAEEHGCRFLFYEFDHREPEFMKLAPDGCQSLEARTSGSWS
jgi:hypothetical protein